MTAPGRRVAPLLVVAVLAIGCGSTVRPSPSASPSMRASTAVPSLTPVPGAASPEPSATLPSTTETEFGRIWDALPSSFPKLGGSAPADQPGPASAIFASTVGDAGVASASIRQALVEQGWTVDVGSPLEDGTVVLEAVGPPAGCKAEIRFTPVGGSLIMTVLYGAACPFS